MIKNRYNKGTRMIQIKEYWRTISFKAIFTVTRTSSVMYFFIGLGEIIIIYVSSYCKRKRNDKKGT